MTEPTDIHVAGVSFRTAEVAVREQLSFNHEEATQFLRKFSRICPGVEATILSTCNRTEFYLATSHPADTVQKLLSSLKQERPGPATICAACQRYEYSGPQAFRHLARVASGLESAVLGDIQILSQVRKAVQIASSAGTLGAKLSQAFTQAVRAGRTARAQTAISRGAASIGSALAEIVCQHVDKDAKAPLKITVLGAGNIARDIGWHLSKRNAGNVVFLSRTRANAEAVAKYCGAESLSWDHFATQLEISDVIVAATGAREPIITRANLDRILALRASNLPLLVDAGMPRNIASGSPIPVIDIDCIRERRDAVLAARNAAVADVELIIDGEVSQWRTWLAAQPVESALASLFAQLNTQSRELAQAVRAAGDPESAEGIISHAMSRILHRHAREVRRATQASLATSKSPLYQQ
jgi:glutamyl-tRNA reductase